jgi:hypothetical protein
MYAQKTWKACAGAAEQNMFDTPNSEAREDVRRAKIRGKKYRAHAAENSRLAESALTREVRDRYRELARHYLALAEEEKHHCRAARPSIWRSRIRTRVIQNLKKDFTQTLEETNCRNPRLFGTIMQRAVRPRYLLSSSAFASDFPFWTRAFHA